MKKLYRFSVNCGRQGQLSGIFVREHLEVAKLFGEVVHFGEVLGKHSDISLEIKSEYFTVLTEDQGFINKFDSLCLETGIIPFDYLEEEQKDSELTS